MSLRLIYGRAGSGKTSYCLNGIKSKIMDGATHPLVLLVPEQYTFQAERDLIRVLETGGILEAEVLSFRRLAFRIFNEAGGITYPHIHSAGKCMIIYRILDKVRGELKVFSKSADRQGFVNTLATLITELKRYNISPEDLKTGSESLAQDDQLKDKLTELTTIYTEFEKTLAQKYRDSNDDLTLAAHKIEYTKMYDGAELWIDGFAGFTPQEYKVIAKLLPKVKRLNITLCTDSLEMEEKLQRVDVFFAVKRSYCKLEKIALELGIEIEEPLRLGFPLLPRFKDSPQLAHLERNIYAYPYKTYLTKGEDLSLFSSVNIFAEIEEAARDIVALCRDKGFRYREIAVVTRNLASYERLIEVIFDEYEIPFFLDRKVEISNHPLIRMILSMLDIFNDNWSYEAVFRYLKTGLTGLERDKVDLIENYVLACGIRGNRWIKDEEWRMSTDLFFNGNEAEDSKRILREINRIRLEITAPLLDFRQKTKGRRKASEIGTALYDFLCKIGVPTRLEEYIEGFRKSGELNLANEYGQVWNIVMEVFDQIVEVMDEETIGLERFTNILKIGLGEYKVGLIPASLDQVLVGSVERSRSHEIKALYILGVNDGVFPASAMEEGILTDLDRAALHESGIELASDTRTQAFDEQYLVYRALTTPGWYLRLSWPLADQEGRSLRPSVIITRLRKIFPGINETSNILKPDNDFQEVKSVVGKSPAFKQMVAAMRRKADGQDISPIWQEVYRSFSIQEEWQSKCEAILRALQYRNIVQDVSRDKIHSLYGEPAYASVSRLEKYTSCPFSFYIQYGLGAKERKVYRLSPPDVGTFMHAVIEKFSRLVAEQEISWRDFEKDWCEAKVSEIVDEMLNMMKGSGIAGSKRYTALTLRLKRVVVRAVWLIAEHMRRSGFNPVGYEVGFGNDAELPPITLELDSGQTIKLIGRIDRVDALKTEEGTYLRIVDYKSGSKDFKLADAYYGLQVQLLTYLDAMWDNPGLNIEGPVLPGGVLYFRIDDPIVRLKGTEEEIEKAIMKELKMKGLLLADVKLIKEMDKTMERNSLIIPASLNKDGEIGRYSSVASLEHFKILRKYLRKLLKGLGEEIMSGKVEINPYKKKTMTSCSYCDYTAICQFDPSLRENFYRLLPDRKDEEIWKLMTGE